MSGTAFPPTIEVLGMNLGSHHTLVGESGGRSAIYSVKEPAIAPGLLQVETEHGVLILAAIAVPTFLGQRERAQDAQVASDLRNVLQAAKTVYVDTQSYGGACAPGGLADKARDIEPAITMSCMNITAGPPTGIPAGAVLNANSVWLFTDGGDDEFLAVGLSQSGNVLCLRDNVTEGTVGPEKTAYKHTNWGATTTVDLWDDAC